MEELIRSMISQTVLPSKWVIVNDGSTDATASIVGQYLAKYDWIELVNLPTHRDRTFAAKSMRSMPVLRRSRTSDMKSSETWIRMFRLIRTIANFC